jgi:D-serine deaminase-like pyridoxal phosphate-dependent protein
MNFDSAGPLTELQCGTYAMMDVEYLDIEPGWNAWPFEPALRVQSSVLSAHWADHVIADAGDKWFASKYGAAPLIVSGAPKDTTFEPISDEHARIMTDGGIQFTPGDRIECVPPHCDPTINLFAAFHVFEHEKLLGIWPISPRGY